MLFELPLSEVHVSVGVCILLDEVALVEVYPPFKEFSLQVESLVSLIHH